MADLDLVAIALLYGVLLISLVVHEASHALVALLGGDRTAYLGGQVTLNPIPHMQREPFGTVILPLLLLVVSNGQWCMGYAHIPVDAVWARRNPKKAALMSAAGPLANFLMVAIAFLVLKALVWSELAAPYPRHGLWVRPDEMHGAVYSVARIATAFAFVNIILGVLNLIPWPPLDGSGVVSGLYPKADRFYDFIRSNVFLMIIGMLVLYRVLPDIFRPIVNMVSGWV